MCVAICDIGWATLLGGILACFLLRWVLLRFVFNSQDAPSIQPKAFAAAPTYDVIVVGASISGTVAAMELAKQGRRVLVVTLDLQRPQTIIGELLQPGGVNMLRRLGLEHCARKVGIPAHGYATQYQGEWVQLPFEDDAMGYSFHHGDFVMELRRELLKFGTDKPEGEPGKVRVVEGTVNRLIFNDGSVGANSPTGARVVGVQYFLKGTNGVGIKAACAPLTIMCDGAQSNLARPSNPMPHSFFIGVVMKGVKLPFEEHGHVVLAPTGPVLSYRLDDEEVRCLVDYTARTLPKDPVRFLLEQVAPNMPDDYRKQFIAACAEGKHKIKPHLLRQPHFPKYRGVVGLGDHCNVRHPLTGGGMTCAMRDAYFLTQRLAKVPDFANVRRTHEEVLRFLRSRGAFSSTVNLLSWALHGVFRGPSVMRQAVYAYFNAGGTCVSVPMAILAALNSSMFDLVYHYIRTMLYGSFVHVCGAPKIRGKANPASSRCLQFVAFCVCPWKWVVLLWLWIYSLMIALPLGFYELLVPWQFIDRTVWSFK